MKGIKSPAASSIYINDRRSIYYFNEEKKKINAVGLVKRKIISSYST